VWLEVAPDIELKVLRSAISDRVERANDDDDDAYDDDEAESSEGAN